MAAARSSKKGKAIVRPLSSKVSEEFIVDLPSEITIRGGWKLSEAMSHLSEVDKQFSPIFTRFGTPAIYKDDTDMFSKFSPFHHLVKTIVYQQLAAAAAEPIFRRLAIALGVGDKNLVEPHHIRNAQITPNVVDGKKKILVNGVVSGLSEAKSKYMVDLAEHFSDPLKLKDVDLDKLTDDELFTKLTAVKGLGPWSVHIFMLFKLHRSNVFPVGDLGIRRGVCLFQNKPLTYYESKKTVVELEQLAKDWSPYCSVASWYMWQLYEEYQKSNGGGKISKKAASAAKEAEQQGDVGDAAAAVVEAADAKPAKRARTKK